MKYVIVEIDLTQSEEPIISRVAGPYTEYEVRRVARDLSNEAANSCEDCESRLMQQAEVDSLSPDVLCAYGAINVNTDEPSTVYLVKELLKA